MTPPPCPLTEQELADFVRQLMAEDGLDPDTGQGDVTSQAVIPQDAVLAAEMVARERIVVCGLPVAVEVFKHLEPGCQVDLFKQDGQMAGPDEALLTVAGRARAILSGERAALNVVQHLSGIATLTHRYVDAIAGTGARLLDTRKTVPGLRKLAKYATGCGGAHNHRMDLSETVLIKDNHLGLAGGVEAAVGEARARGQVDVEVECDTLEQVEAALTAQADRILLDNMGPTTLKLAVEMAAGRVPLEASGGVTLEAIRAIAETGVDFISVGRITQSAPAVDIGLDYLT